MNKMFKKRKRKEKKGITLVKDYFLLELEFEFLPD